MAWHFDKVLTKEIATIEMGPFCYAPEIRLSKDLPITATQEAFRERHPIPPGWDPLPHQ